MLGNGLIGKELSGTYLPKYTPVGVAGTALGLPIRRKGQSVRDQRVAKQLRHAIIPLSLQDVTLAVV